MSSHFTYEIDERKLRVRLKQQELPYCIEAWQQLEKYTGKQCCNHKASSFKWVNLRLNPSVIMPVVFGVIILVFSLLLFNFVNIKKTSRNSTKTKTAAETPVPSPSNLTQQQVNTPVQINRTKSLPVDSENTIINPLKSIPEKNQPVSLNISPIDVHGANNKSTQHPARQANLQGISGVAQPVTITLSAMQKNTEEVAADNQQASQINHIQTRLENDSATEIRPALNSEEHEAKASPN